MQPQISEKQLHSAVVDAAKHLGYFTFFIPDWMYMLAIKAQARGLHREWSPPGFPDLVLLQGLLDPRTPVRLIFMELKSRKGAVRPVQHDWLTGLSRVQGIEVYVLRPADWIDGTIDRILSNGPYPDHPGTLKELRKQHGRPE